MDVTRLSFSTAKCSVFGSPSPEQYDKIAQKFETPKHLITAAPAIHHFQAWDGDISSRRFDVVADGLTLECFGTPSTTKRLFIYLSAAGRKGFGTSFHRVRWHQYFDGVGLSIEDPTYKAILGKTGAGWYFGTKKKHALPIVADVVRKVQQRYNIANEDVCFIGSSSGGFAGIWLADAIPGAASLAGNPQFDALKWPSAKQYLKHGINLESLEYASRTNLNHISFDSASRHFIIVNAKSNADYQVQLPAFLRARGLSSVKYGLNRHMNLSIYCRNYRNMGAISPHAALDDVNEARLFLSIIDSNTSPTFKTECLNMLHEMQYTRFGLSDRIFFAGLWGEFLRGLNLPVTLPAQPIGETTAKFLFPGAEARAHYEVRWIANGKQIEIKLRVRSEKGRLAVDLSEMAADNYKIRKDWHVLVLGKFQKAQAKEKFEEVVNLTYSDVRHIVFPSNSTAVNRASEILPIEAKVPGPNLKARQAGLGKLGVYARRIVPMSLKERLWAGAGAAALMLAFYDFQL